VAYPRTQVAVAVLIASAAGFLYLVVTATGGVNWLLPCRWLSPPPSSNNFIASKLEQSRESGLPDLQA
jgi:hypothetical protein